jgi:hypothetical protein
VSKEVVGESESDTSAAYDLVIAAATPTASQNGLYTATPVLIFDAIPKLGQ